MARADHTPIPRHRDRAGPALLDHGFRPFFLGAGLWAAVAVAAWLMMLAGALALPTAFDPLSWHVHEMLFGFVAAAVGGFVLTAIPNWTGRPPLQGAPLAALATLWLAGRVAVALSAWAGIGVAAAVDLAYLVALAGVCAREIVVAGNWRNLPVAGALALLALANALFHAGAAGLLADDGAPTRAAIAVLVGLIALIGGRIVPSFTRNWLARRDAARMPAPHGRYDRVTLAVAAVALAAWAVVGEAMWVAAALALAAALLLGRLARWRGQATAAEPLVWVLHLGYLWLPVGLALLAAGMAADGVPPALHALSAGAMGTMTLAVMTRATLGHTGRPLTAGPATTVIYLLVTAAAVGRLASGVVDGAGTALLHASATCWVGAFALFVAAYGPALLRPRA